MLHNTNHFDITYIYLTLLHFYIHRGFQGMMVLHHHHHHKCTTQISALVCFTLKQHPMLHRRYLPWSLQSWLHLLLETNHRRTNKELTISPMYNHNQLQSTDHIQPAHSRHLAKLQTTGWSILSLYLNYHRGQVSPPLKYLQEQSLPQQVLLLAVSDNTHFKYSPVVLE